MSKQGGLGDNLYVGGYDISGDVGAVQTISAKRALLDVTAIDKSAHERVVGLRDGEIGFNSWFDDATDKEHDALKGLPTTDRIVMYFRGAAMGSPVAALRAKQINYDWDRGADASLQGTIQALANDFGLEWCEALTAGKRTDTTATAVPASVDYGAVSTLFGMAAYLEVFAFAGTSVTVKVRDSADNVTFADITGGDFAAVSAVPAQERIETGLTATIRRYVGVATSGTFTNAVFAVAFIRYLTARDP